MARSYARSKKVGRTKSVLAQKARRMREKTESRSLDTIDITVTPRQKELAALKEAGILTDGTQTFSDDSVHSVLQDIIAKVASSVSQDVDISQGASTSAAKDNCTTLSAVENSNASQTVSSHDNSTIQKATKIFLTPKGIPTNKLKISKRSIGIQNNFDAEKILKNKPYSKYSNSYNALKINYPVKGRRIINVGHFFRSMQRLNKHSKLGCDLNDFIITKEIKRGIRTSFCLKCRKCNFRRILMSDVPKPKEGDLNVKFIEGMLDLNCDFDDMNKLLAKLHLPSLKAALYAEILKNKISVDEMTRIPEKTNSVANFQIIEKKKKKQLEIAKKFSEQSTTTQDSSSAKSANRGIAEKLHKNTQKEPQAITFQESIPSASDKSKNSHQNGSVGLLLVEHQLEIKEENAIEGESELIIPDQKTKEPSSSELAVSQEQAILNVATIKQEINSDLDNENFAGLKTCEIVNKKSINEYVDRSMAVLSRHHEVRSHENTFNQNPSKFHGAVRIHDNNRLTEPRFNNMEIIDKESVIDADINLSELELPPLKKARNVLDESEVVVNQDRTKLGEKRAEPKFSDKEKTVDKMRIDSSFEAESGRITNNQQMLSAVHEQNKDRFFESRSESNRLVTETSTATTLGRENVYLIPSQHVPQPNENRVVFHPYMPPNLTNGPYQGVNGAAFVPGTSTIVQQHSNETGGLLPLMNMHSSWFHNQSVPSNNPLIILPSISGPAYTTIMPNVICQPPNLSNSGGLTYTSNVPTAVQQTANLSNNEKPSTANIPRWIGRENMSSNSPYNLPGGAPKGVSDPVPTKPPGDQSNHISKRPRFRCDDCDVDFVKYESWKSHKKSYCVKRLKLPTSSTVSSHTSISNNTPEPTHMNHENQVTPSLKPNVEELFSAMAIKRSFLEASMESALEAQYVINLHKSAQDLTKKTFKELDDALSREKALMSGASLEEQDIIHEAKAQAVMRAEAAYMQEKYSAAAVEQALCRQKAAIEATITASRHEQTAFISTMRGLKMQTNQNYESSTLQTEHQNHFCKTNVNQVMTDASFSKEQEQTDNIPLRSVSVHKATLTSSDSCIEQKNEIGMTSHTNRLQNVSYINVQSEKLNTKNRDKSKIAAVMLETPQHKEMDVETSSDSFEKA